MAVNIKDDRLERRIAVIAAKQVPPASKRALVLAMIDQACRKCEAAKDPMAWKAGRE